MKTVDFLDAIKERYQLPSDYAAAALLGVSRARISTYRTDKAAMGEEIAPKVAELLGLDAGYVLACLQAERSRDPATKKLWEGAADTLKRAAAAAKRKGRKLGPTAHVWAMALLTAILSGFWGGGPDGGAQAAVRFSAESPAFSSEPAQRTFWKMVARLIGRLLASLDPALWGLKPTPA